MLLMMPLSLRTAMRWPQEDWTNPRTLSKRQRSTGQRLLLDSTTLREVCTYVQMDARSVVLYSCFMLRTVIVLMSSIIIVEQHCSSYIRICNIVWWWLPVCHIRIYNTHQKFLYLRVHLFSKVTLPRFSLLSSHYFSQVCNLPTAEVTTYIVC